MNRELHRGPEPPENPEKTDGLLASLMDVMNLQVDLEDLEGPSAEELAAMDELDAVVEDDLAALDALEAIPLPFDMIPAPMPRPAPSARSEPEIVSLESLDDVEADAALDDELSEGDDLLDELPEDYIDIDLEDDELDDAGYDLDDEDIDNYQDLYGEDDSIIPSFREGEALDEDDDEGEIAFYDDLR